MRNNAFDHVTESAGKLASRRKNSWCYTLVTAQLGGRRNMLRRFQVLLRGTDFSVPVEDGDPIRGFYAVRRVLADSPENAERQALASLQAEEKFQWMVETTERELGRRTGCLVRIEKIRQLSWFVWHFSHDLKSYIFFSNEGGSAEHE